MLIVLSEGVGATSSLYLRVEKAKQVYVCLMNNEKRESCAYELVLFALHCYYCSIGYFVLEET